MTNRCMPILLAMLAASVLVIGCKSKGPAPGDGLTEREDVIMAEREKAPSGLEKLGVPHNEYERDYRSIPHDPHGPAAGLNPPPSHVSGRVERVDLGGLTIEPPVGWEYQHPTSAMRRAEFGVRSDDGTAGLVVFFFGNQGAGSARANMDRWVGQFRNPDGTPIPSAAPTKRTIAGFKTTQVEVAGTYVGGMGAGSTQGEGQPDQRMIAAIVDTAKGPFYFKFLGANKTILENRKSLDELFASMKLSQ